MKEYNGYNKQIRWFTLLELIIVITIVMIILSFWFINISNYLWNDDTLRNIEEINNNIINERIFSNFNNSKNVIYFSNSINWFYYVYNDNYWYNNDFYIKSWSILNDYTLEFYLSSDTILSKNLNLIIDNWFEIISKNIDFDSLWNTNLSNYIENKDIDNYKIYLKDNDWKKVTWNIKLISFSKKNDLFLNKIIWTNFSNFEIYYDSLEILSLNNWKTLIYWINNNLKQSLIKSRLIFIDKKNNIWFFDIK